MLKPPRILLAGLLSKPALISADMYVREPCQQMLALKLQDAQRDVMRFVTGCQFYSENSPSVRSWTVLRRTFRFS
jgi:hypothetical protein